MYASSRRLVLALDPPRYFRDMIRGHPLEIVWLTKRLETYHNGPTPPPVGLIIGPQVHNGVQIAEAFCGMNQSGQVILCTHLYRHTDPYVDSLPQRFRNLQVAYYDTHYDDVQGFLSTLP